MLLDKTATFTSAKVEVTLSDGIQLTEEIDAVRGTAKNR